MNPTNEVLPIRACSTNTWITGTLEIHHLNVGQGAL